MVDDLLYESNVYIVGPRNVDNTCFNAWFSLHRKISRVCGLEGAIRARSGLTQFVVLDNKRRCYFVPF